MSAVGEPDPAARAALRERLRAAPVAAAALGGLASTAEWLAGVQGCAPPWPPRRVRALVVAGDHGIAAAGVSARSPGATEELAAAVLAGAAPVSVLAGEVGAGVALVDVAVDTAVPVGDARHRVRRSSDRFDRDDALRAGEADRALAAGAALAEAEVDAGAELLVAGHLGVGATTAAAAVVAALAGAEPAVVVGRGSGVDDAGWMRKVVAVRDGLRRIGRTGGDPVRVLGAVGGADLAALAGLLTAAARRRTPVLLDGVVVAAAALAAATLEPAAAHWWRVGCRSAEPAERIVADRLGLPALLDLAVGPGDGTGALLALPLLRAAAELSPAAGYRPLSGSPSGTT